MPRAFAIRVTDDERVLAELGKGEHEGRWAPLDLKGELVEVDVASFDLAALSMRIAASRGK